MRSFGGLLGLMVVGASLGTGCATARMVVPEGLERDSQVIEVTRHRSGWFGETSLAFGGYQVKAIDRSWVRGQEISVGRFSGDEKTQRYTFDLIGPEQGARKVTCDTRANGIRVSGRSWSVGARSSELSCEVREGAGENASVGRLSFDSSNGTWLGSFARGSLKFEVRPVMRLRAENGPESKLGSATPTGYELLRAGQVVGAVETLQAQDWPSSFRATVWMHQSAQAEEQDGIATVAAMMMLFREIPE